VTNACQVFHRVGSGPQDFVYGGAAVNLDAGAAITLAGPNITAANNQLMRQTGNIYNDSLGTAISIPGVNFPIPGYNANPVISSGTYTLTGTGGADVGAFTAKVTVGTPLAVGTLPASVNRASGLSVTWTGGAPADIVNITGYSGVTVGGTPSAPIYDSAVFVCTTTADKGRFDVPSSVLQQLPVTPADSANGTGALVVISSSQPVANNGLFTAPLVAGGNIDTGVFLSSSGLFKTMLYQ
jgi:hypothetical protein